MVVFPNIKINLGLNVLSKRPDGYHNLQSIFYPVQWCDILEIVKSDEFLFKVSGLEIPGKPEENLVIKAYKLLQKEFDLPPVAIYLHKVIPTGAGLGAGSSDATFTLSLLNKLFDLKLTDEALLNYAAMLGSDCPFFVYNSPCLVTGRGENVQKITLNLSGYWIKLVHTGLEISTREAFQGIQPNNNASDLISAINKDPKLYKNCFKNDFELYLMANYPVLNQLKTELQKEGAFYVSMSGSGSAFYGLFEKKPTNTGIGKFEFITKLHS
ncbi:MAG: 4-(cytidine 5'-diphospho)-2-C-methyl-D-erythritol kinase [Bacteroidetes bacterium]|nr:4-(cytidine 5'-diphospho)-2-C-methyl-D-erythritol kinase [Bacteroidota bacterium]